MNSTILLDEGKLTIRLPGLTAVHIDTAGRVVAVDHISGSTDTGLTPEWTVRDFRGDTYGDFHGLADQCYDPECAPHAAHKLATELAEEIVAEKVGAGEIVRLEGGRLVEASKYDPAVHGPAA